MNDHSRQLMISFESCPELIGSLSGRSLDEEFPADPRAFSSGKKIVARIFGEEARGGVASSYRVNVIPGGHPGECLKVLFVAIGTNDSVKMRILEAVAHVSARCPGTRAVLFYAMWWSATEWAAYRVDLNKAHVDCWVKMPFQAPVQLL